MDLVAGGDVRGEPGKPEGGRRAFQIEAFLDGYRQAVKRRQSLPLRAARVGGARFRPGSVVAFDDEAREKVTEYVKTLFEAGEKDEHRLTVCGLTYLRQLDGSSDPVKAGYTGL